MNQLKRDPDSEQEKLRQIRAILTSLLAYHLEEERWLRAAIEKIDKKEGMK